MEGGEIINCIKVWLIVFVSLSYCYTIGKIVPKGIIRLLTILPIVCIFFALPLNLNSIHFVGITAFFIAWLSNFRLLLFAFGKGPLSSIPSSSITLPIFIAVGCLPIKIQEDPSQKIDPKSQIDINPSLKTQIQEDPSQKIDQKSQIDINPSLKTQIKEDPSQIIDQKSQLDINPTQKIDPESKIDINPSLKTQIQEDPSQKIDQKSQIQEDPSQKNDQKSKLDINPSQKLDPKSKIGINPSLKTQIQEDPSQKIDPKSEIEINPSQNPTKKCLKSPLNYTIKVLLLAIIVRVYDYGEYIHPTVIYTLYWSHIYIILEITLAIVAAMAEAILGLKLEPQFNEPYLATSLQNFWGRRWNIVVSSTILRPTVYEPVLYFCSTRIMGRKWASLPAVFTTFLVSGLMHELIFFYMGREKPTWEMTWFFVLHGVYVMVEIVLKKKFNGIFMLPPLISRFLTFVFLVVTLLWLYFPLFLRCRVMERAFEEYAIVGAFAKDIWSRVCMKYES